MTTLFAVLMGALMFVKAQVRGLDSPGPKLMPGVKILEVIMVHRPITIGGVTTITIEDLEATLDRAITTTEDQELQTTIIYRETSTMGTKLREISLVALIDLEVATEEEAIRTITIVEDHPTTIAMAGELVTKIM